MTRPPPWVLTRAREVIFIETLLILPPPPHLIPNTTNPGTSSDSSLSDGWGRRWSLDAVVLVNGGLGCSCCSGAEGRCQWVHSIFRRLQTQSINKNIYPQHTGSLVKSLGGLCDLFLTAAVSEFPGRVGSSVGFHIFSSAIHHLCVSLQHLLTNFVQAALGGSICWGRAVSWRDHYVMNRNFSYSRRFPVQIELEN